MLDFLQHIFIGHTHKWVEQSSHPAVNAKGEMACVIVVLRCTVCGGLKNYKITT